MKRVCANNGCAAGLVFLAAGLAAGPAHAASITLPVAADAYVSTLFPATNFGMLPTVNVNAGEKTLLQFDLGALAGVAAEDILSATLVLPVQSVLMPGAFGVSNVASAWSEQTVTMNTQPLFGTSVAFIVPVSAPDPYRRPC